MEPPSDCVVHSALCTHVLCSSEGVPPGGPQALLVHLGVVTQYIVGTKQGMTRTKLYACSA